MSLVCLLAGCAADPKDFRGAVAKGTGVVRLPAGVVELSRELVIPQGARDLEVVGHPDGTILRASDTFEGRAVVVCVKAENIRLRGFTIDGNREALAKPIEIAPSDVPFVDFYSSNGLLANEVSGLRVTEVKFRNVTNFAVLVARSKVVELERIEVRDSGSRNAKGRNNTSGGVLFEEGTDDFAVRDSLFLNVLGNGVWTHSMYTSPRNKNGVITGNRFEELARDAVQVGHATAVTVEHNTGKRIGYPLDAVDVEGGGIPVGIDTSGDVDHTSYVQNRFEEINGKCIDLDGFHDGAVRANTCINRGAAADYPSGHFGIVMNNANPDMQSENIVIEDNVIDGTKFGGIFIVGSGHKVTDNKLLNINKAGCNESAAQFGCYHFPGEPELLQTGIYLGKRAERPAVARNNVVEGNQVSGHKMASRCIALAPGVSRADNIIGDNTCEDGGSE
ncbi:MAG: right-handed parallel beta-helix repeat-containing protein [bacterium]|nr:right-handed parallel beta-helix repeat-containing protein [bacterium]